MATLKDVINGDLDLFLNIDDFAEEHKIDGVLIKVVIDAEGLAENQKGTRMAISESTLKFFAKSADLGKVRIPGQKLSFDNKLYVVDAWDEDMGITSVFLSDGRN